jgi:hypothetical protein
VVTAKELTDDDRALLYGRVEHVFQKGAFSREELLLKLRAILRERIEAPRGEGATTNARHRG